MILVLLIMALFPIGIHVVTGEGMILQSAGQWMETTVKHFPSWVRKPMWTCPRCMCLWWGGPAALGVNYGPEWLQWGLILIAAVGLQDLLDK